MATANPPPVTKAEQIRAFAEAFFTHFGAQLQPHGDELIVTLPPELVEAFGKPKLYLVFPAGRDGEPRDLSPNEDLLVYGSRTFDQMLALLANRGEVAQLHFATTIDIAFNKSPLSLHNCQVIENKVASRDELFYLFNFRVIYVSDEKQEQFITIALDASGQPRPDIIEFVAQFDSQPHLPDALHTTDAQILGLKLNQAELEVKKLIDDEADVLQQAIQERLQKVLLRLHTYYQRLLDEIDADDPIKAEALRNDLQQDLSRQVADEMERHRLRVTVSSISHAVAVIPVADHTLTLATHHTQQMVSLTQNLHSGQVDLLTCHHCDQPVDTLALCDHEHLVHAHCLDTCHCCQKEVCHRCGIQSCAICDKKVCFECVASCAYDDRWLCAEHIQQCAICGQNYCSDHAATCGVCSQSYCHNCVDTNAECTTCRTAQLSEVAADVQPPAIPGQKTDRLQWRSSQNQVYTIYIGQLPNVLAALGRMVVVVDQAGQVVFWTKTGLLKWLL